jgi:hypothetical protein
MSDIIEINQIEVEVDPIHYGDGQFDFIERMHDRYILQNAFWAITECGLWDWIRSFNETSFMFSDSPNIGLIMAKMQEQDIGTCHSGSSFAFTMRAMEYLAKNGIYKFCKTYGNKRS